MVEVLARPGILYSSTTWGRYETLATNRERFHVVRNVEPEELLPFEATIREMERERIIQALENLLSEKEHIYLMNVLAWLRLGAPE
jgi:hypothetical protein